MPRTDETLDAKLARIRQDIHEVYHELSQIDDPDMNEHLISPMNSLHKAAESLQWCVKRIRSAS